ncbi:MAG: FAD-dependent oxidoreductase [bacterium]|nr:FAD-dependent oxidoreductase [bacterium]
MIGGNAAGMAAALRARRSSSELDITIIEQSRHLAIATCSIPAYLEDRIDDIDRLQQLTSDDLGDKYGVNVMLLHRVLEVHAVKHQLSVENITTGQSFDLPFDRLIIATGASPVYPAWASRGTEGIFTLRNLEDAYRLKQFLLLKHPKQFVIVGTGTIAQVCAEGLQASGAQIVMIGQCQGLMEDLDEAISSRISTVLTTNDISLYYTDNEPSIHVSLENEIESVRFPERTISCGGILLAMGINPNTNFCKSAGIVTNEFGAIRVDRHLMTSRQGIFSCGDCAMTYHHLTHKPFYWPLATTAARQGRQAGESAVSGNGIDHGSLGMRFWTCFNLQIGRVGLSPKQAEDLSIKYRRVAIRSASKPRLYGGSEMDLVVLSDPGSGRLLGAQIAGFDGVHARLNALAVAIEGKLILSDLERLDLAYTPKYSSLWDPLQIAGRVGDKLK